MKVIRHIFRAYGLHPFERRERGMLTVCRGDLVIHSHKGFSTPRIYNSEQAWFVYFRYWSVSGVSVEVGGEYRYMVMFDALGHAAKLGDEERDLGTVKLICFRDDVVAGPNTETHSFEVYNRLPVPPRGSQVRSVHGVAAVKPRVIA